MNRIEGVADAERIAARYNPEAVITTPAEVQETEGKEESKEQKKGSQKSKKGSKKKSSKPKEKRSEKQKAQSALRALLIKIGIIAVLTTIIFIWVGGVAVSHDTNMYPAVSDGDLAITYKLGGYYNGDIVVYKHNGVSRFGRVAAIPGDVIDIREDGSYTVNGVMPMESINQPTYRAQDSDVKYPYTVKPGEVFVLNDYRENAYDSRVIGGIETSDLKGKVVLLMRRRGF